MALAGLDLEALHHSGPGARFSEPPLSLQPQPLSAPWRHQPGKDRQPQPMCWHLHCPIYGAALCTAGEGLQTAACRRCVGQAGGCGQERVLERASRTRLSQWKDVHVQSRARKMQCMTRAHPTPGEDGIPAGSCPGPPGCHLIREGTSKSLALLLEPLLPSARTPPPCCRGHVPPAAPRTPPQLSLQHQHPLEGQSTLATSHIAQGLENKQGS